MFGLSSRRFARGLQGVEYHRPCSLASVSALGSCGGCCRGGALCVLSMHYSNSVIFRGAGCGSGPALVLFGIGDLRCCCRAGPWWVGVCGSCGIFQQVLSPAPVPSAGHYRFCRSYMGRFSYLDSTRPLIPAFEKLCIIGGIFTLPRMSSCPKTAIFDSLLRGHCRYPHSSQDISSLTNKTVGGVVSTALTLSDSFCRGDTPHTPSIFF